jgi:hypothetical protein
VLSIRSDQVGIWLVDMKLIVRVYDILIRSITVYELGERERPGGAQPKRVLVSISIFFVVLIFDGTRSRWHRWAHQLIMVRTGHVARSMQHRRRDIGRVRVVGPWALYGCR